MKGRQKIAVGAATHPGQIRELNEDAIGTPEEMRVLADRRVNRGELLVVADGMGGHAAGEVASQLAITTVYEEYYNDSSPDLGAGLKRAVEKANSRIHAEGSSDPGKHGMGTTLVAALIHGSRLIVANVGDSRAYLVRRGQIRQISRDHSWVAQSVAAGLISEEQARHHAQRSLVLRALGQKPEVEVDIFYMRVRPGDAVVLCSDGLSNEVGDGEIAQVVGGGSAWEGAADLVALANGRLGRDNISAVVAKIPSDYGQVVTLPVALLGIVALAAIGAAAILLARPWQEAVTTRATAASSAVVAAPVSTAASMPSPTASALSSSTREVWTAMALDAAVQQTAEAMRTQMASEATQTALARPTDTSLPAATPTPSPTSRPAPMNTSPPHPTPTPRAQGRLAFMSERDGNPEIYTMNADGSGATRLTNHPALDDGPAWSPDGRRIAFVSEREGNREIYVMNSDGSGQINLTNHPATDSHPSWSADGRRIAFQSDRTGNREVFVMNADGSGPVNVTNHPAKDEDPSWSPAGARIAFFSNRDGEPEIYVVNADGGGLTRLTFNDSGEFTPAWSPDGGRLVFMSDREGNREVYVMNADGSGQTRLTSHPAHDYEPAWSRDGRRMAFVSQRDGNPEIYAMNADGGDVTRLTNHPASDNSPAWSP
jgi:Tol biopolymer transport system component/serine/threonine protein phosphatase PrpC